jgi:hypothetical protein
VGRRLDVDQLVSAQDIAEEFGLARRQVVTTWAARHPDFPAPAVKKLGITLWYLPEVRAWMRSTGRSPRPPI